ncbi:MAG TPA: hypothetical protein VF861_04470 [Telluria sp.]
MRVRRLLLKTTRHPSAILLGAQLIGMLLFPFVEQAPGAGVLAFNAFGMMILAFTARMIRSTPGFTGFSVALALAIIALLILQMVYRLPHLQAWSSGLAN